MGPVLPLLSRGSSHVLYVEGKHRLVWLAPNPDWSRVGTNPAHYETGPVASNGTYLVWGPMEICHSSKLILLKRKKNGYNDIICI